MEKRSPRWISFHYIAFWWIFVHRLRKIRLKPTKNGGKTFTLVDFHSLFDILVDFRSPHPLKRKAEIGGKAFTQVEIHSLSWISRICIHPAVQLRI